MNETIFYDIFRAKRKWLRRKFRGRRQLRVLKNLGRGKRVKIMYDISERRSKISPPSTFTLFPPRPLGCCAISKDSSYTKNEYNLSLLQIRSSNAFLFDNFFKIALFFEKPANNCFWDTFDHFSGKGCVLP